MTFKSAVTGSTLPLPTMTDLINYSKMLSYKSVAAGENVTTGDLNKIPIMVPLRKNSTQLYYEEQARKVDNFLEEYYNISKGLIEKEFAGIPVTTSGRPAVYHSLDLVPLTEAMKKEMYDICNSKVRKKSEEMYELYEALTNNKYVDKAVMRREVTAIASRYKSDKDKEREARIEAELSKSFSFDRNIDLTKLADGKTLLDSKTQYRDGEEFNLLLLTGKDNIDNVDPEDYMKVRVIYLRITGREKDAIYEVKKFFSLRDENWSSQKAVVYINSLFRVNRHAELRQLVKNILVHKFEETKDPMAGIPNAKKLLKAYSTFYRIEKVEEKVDGKAVEGTKEATKKVECSWSDLKVDNFLDTCIGMLIKENAFPAPALRTKDARKKAVEENKGSKSGLAKTSVKASGNKPGKTKVKEADSTKKENKEKVEKPAEEGNKNAKTQAGKNQKKETPKDAKEKKNEDKKPENNKKPVENKKEEKTGDKPATPSGKEEGKKDTKVPTGSEAANKDTGKAKGDEKKDAKSAVKTEDKAKSEKPKEEAPKDDKKKETPKDAPKDDKKEDKKPADKKSEDKKSEDNKSTEKGNKPKNTKEKKQVELVLRKMEDGTYCAAISGFSEVVISGAKSSEEAQTEFEEGLKKYFAKVAEENEKAKSDKDGKGKKIIMLPEWYDTDKYEMKVVKI